MNHNQTNKSIILSSNLVTETTDTVETTTTNSDQPVKKVASLSLKSPRKSRSGRDRKGGSKVGFKPVKTEFEEKLVKWKRVSKTTKGGRRGRIWTLAIVGNRKGSVGFGIGKAEEFPDAMKKAVKNALKNVVKVKINPYGTVYHENIGKHCASKLIIKPAKFGSGIIAGGPIKTVLELAGYSDVYSKNLGSSCAMNMVQATINALLKQRTPEEINLLRGRKTPPATSKTPA